MYLPKTLRHKQDLTQGQFLSVFQLVCIMSFPSPRPIAIPRFKTPIGLTIDP